MLESILKTMDQDEWLKVAELVQQSNRKNDETKSCHAI